MRFKETLEKYGITQMELADRLGINRVSVSRLLSEKNDIRLSTIEKIAKAIGCKVGDFFADEMSGTDFTALVKSGNEFFCASSLKELEDIVSKLKAKS
uniref:helix-turn-helix domain-containing protein n=1 Tax=Alloprevotella sp. TaxID=1872471 RepID=UPI003FF0790B